MVTVAAWAFAWDGGISEFSVVDSAGQCQMGPSAGAEPIDGLCIQRLSPRPLGLLRLLQRRLKIGSERVGNWDGCDNIVSKRGISDCRGQLMKGGQREVG